MEAMAIAHHFDGYGWQYIDNGSGSDWLAVGKKYDDAIVLVDQDDALAIVAAAYRDAADWLLDMRAVDDDGNETMPEADVYVTLINNLPKRTPADAETHLTALLRAEYERGVRDAAARVSEPSMLGLTLVKMEQRILAILTQEGR